MSALFMLHPQGPGWFWEHGWHSSYVKVEVSELESDCLDLNPGSDSDYVAQGKLLQIFLPGFPICKVVITTLQMVITS